MRIRRPRVAVYMAAFAVALFWIGGKNLWLARKSANEPQTLALADLIEKGYGTNAHVRLTKFWVPPFSGFVHNGKDEKGWTEVFVPAHPLDGEYQKKAESVLNSTENVLSDRPMPTPAAIPIFFKMSAPNGIEDVRALMHQAEIEGLIVSDVESIGSKSRDVLAGYYPGVDLKHGLILEIDKHRPSEAEVWGPIGVGVVTLYAMFRFCFSRSRGTPETA